VTNIKNATLGFTMIDLIVALVILGTSFIAIIGSMSICSRAAHHTRMLTKSVLLAESLLVETMLKKNMAFETTSGQEGLYKWRIQMAPTPIENLGAVCVQVKWQEQGRWCKYELISLVNINSLIGG
jgi:Tfp pilus assembly protein PilE